MAMEPDWTWNDDAPMYNFSLEINRARAISSNSGSHARHTNTSSSSYERHIRHLEEEIHRLT